MAPTGVLARQYADKTGPLLSQAGMSWALLTGATPAAERELIHSQLESGELDVLFGTHAVLSEDVNFKHLSLVVIDEQHRFGVGQRNALRAKGPGADLLVMTATPSRARWRSRSTATWTRASFAIVPSRVPA